MDNPKAVRRLVLWEIELSEFNIWYCLRNSIKAQALADFIVEFTVGKIDDQGATTWKVQMDGSSNKRTEGIRVVLQFAKGDIIECAIWLQFSMTNNEAEYEAILIGLDLAKATGALSIVLHNDSQVVVRHINGDYEAKGEWMKKYLNLISRWTNQTFEVKFLQVLREENEHNDWLAKAAFMEHIMINRQVLSFILLSPTIEELEI